MRVETPSEDFNSGPDALVDTAALMAHLDLVVTCDTSIAHLAGALARPVWVALKSDAEWRWMTERDNSPWYPTMRLFRQPTRGAWGEVFDAMAAALSETLAARRPPRAVRAPCSIGDLIDRITILRIKAERLTEEAKCLHVRRELELLECEARQAGVVGGAVETVADDLAEVNGQLWEVEDALRRCERDADFGPPFVALARSVYVLNDRRAALKREINALFGSELMEEKELRVERIALDPGCLLAGRFFAPRSALRSRKPCNVMALLDLQPAGCGLERARNRRLNRSGTGAEQAFIRSEQAKNRRAKRGRETGRGRVVRRGQDSLPPRVERPAPGRRPGGWLFSRKGRREDQRARLQTFNAAPSLSVIAAPVHVERRGEAHESRA